MGVIKNDVGRPSNKTIMIRRILKLILALIIVGLAVALGYFIKSKEDDKKISNSKTEIINVNKLYGYFKNIPFSSSFDKFYTEEGILSKNISDEYMLSIAANDLKAITCKGKYEYETDCMDEKEILNRTEEIFGKKVKLNDGIEIFPQCVGYTYSSLNSEFYLTGEGSTSVEYIKNMYDYKIENDKVYIYEVVAINNFASDEYTDIAGNKIEIPYGTNEKNIIDYKEKLDKFKWTFVKNEDGNYIFDKVEKVK